MTETAMPRTVLRPVVQESTVAIVARQLREAVATGELPQGAQLTEIDLAAELGVSRGPLREAMQRLTAEGLLISRRNRGLFVMTLSDEDVRDVYDSRASVERAAVARIVAGDTSAAAEVLAGAVDRILAADVAGSPSAAELADLSFHATLVAQAGSPRLQRAHETLLIETRMLCAARGAAYVNGPDRIAEHRLLVDAIARGDALAADALLVVHMTDGVKRILG